MADLFFFFLKSEASIGQTFLNSGAFNAPRSTHYTTSVNLAHYGTFSLATVKI